MASMNTVSVGFDQESLQAIADLKSAVAYLNAHDRVDDLIHACHALRISD